MSFGSPVYVILHTENTCPQIIGRLAGGSFTCSFWKDKKLFG